MASKTRLSLSSLSLGVKAIVQTVPTQESLDPKAPSGDFWDRAYQLLREDQSQKSSLNKYEEIPASEYGGQYQSHVVSGSMTSSDKEKMAGLVAKMLERIEDERWRIKVRDTSIELRPQVDRFVNAVIAVKDFVSSAVSSEPHATLAWAGVCIILPLLTNPTMQQESLVEGVDHISTVIVRFAVLDRLYRSRTPSPTQKDMIDFAKLFETQTIKLYSQILSYQARVICQLARAAPLQASRDVIKVDDWAVKITEIKTSEAASQETFRLLGLETADKALEDQDQRMHKALEDHHERMVELFQQLESRKHNGSAELLAWKQTVEESACFQALCIVASTYKDTKNRNRPRVPNTCRWFLDSRIFHDWTGNPSSVLLWVTADPGCGKSVLSKSLVEDELRSTELSTTAYFFFKDDSPETRSVLCALSALLHQLGSKKRTLLSIIVAQYQSKGDQMLRSFSWLWDLLLETTSRPENGKIVCVLDALDECEDTERAVLIDALNSLQQTGNGQLKFLATSRPYSSIEERFDKSTPRLAGENESEELKTEIDLVIKDKVAGIAKRKKLNQKTRDRLQERLIKTENRTYLWLHLVLPALEKTLIRNPSDVDHEIDQVSNLDDAYEAILNRSPRPEQAQRLLHIIVAAVRPLTIHETNIALNIKRGDKCLETMDLDPEDALISNIKTICGLFVSVHNSQVYLLHQTAKEFLVRPSRPKNNLLGASPSAIQGDDSCYQLPPRYLHEDAVEDNVVMGQTTPMRSQLTTTIPSEVRIWKHSLDPVESHHVLAKICLAYLLFDFTDKSLRILHPDVDRPDCIRAVPGLLSRLAAIEEKSNRDLNLELPSSGPTPQETLSDSDKPKDSAEVNSLSARSELISMDQWPDLTSSGISPHDALKLPASPTPYDTAFHSDGRNHVPNPLSHLSSLSEKRMRDLLPKRHDGLRYASQHWALHYEAARHDDNLQELWLSFCISDSPKFAHWNPSLAGAELSQLALASLFGHNGVVAHLLKVNVDIECRDSGDNPPLMCAVKFGNETAVDILLASGVLVDSIGYEGRTPLWFAAHKGEDKIAEKLINGGALVNPELILKTPEISECGLDDDMDLNGSSPLGAAFATLIASSYATLQRTRYLKVIRLLLDRGAVVYSGVRKASPLWLAIESCYKFNRRQESIVKLLLSKGADINFRDTEDEFTPLHRAVANKVVPMVELIFKGKPKLDVQDFEGRTPLYAALSWASGNDVDTIVHMLLKAGSDPKIASVEGIALHPAAKKGRLGCVKLLLTAGADANAKDYGGRTPLDLVQKELEDEQRIRKQRPRWDFRVRDREGLMKVVELLKPITTESVGTHENTCQYQSSQSNSSPSAPDVYPTNSSDLEHA